MLKVLYKMWCIVRDTINCMIHIYLYIIYNVENRKIFGLCLIKVACRRYQVICSNYNGRYYYIIDDLFKP